LGLNKIGWIDEQFTPYIPLKGDSGGSLCGFFQEKANLPKDNHGSLNGRTGSPPRGGFRGLIEPLLKNKEAMHAIVVMARMRV
jgi:hypothetical protein